MRHPLQTSQRPGYTLLEMILASTIAVLLLSALYVAMDMQLRLAGEARDIVQQSTIARNILQRISADITPALGQIDPSRYSSNNGSSSASAASSATASPTSTTPTTSGTGTTGGTSTTPTASLSGTNPTFITLQGDATSLNLTVTRHPKLPATQDNPEVPSGVSDLSRIAYFLAGGSGDSSLGLARWEMNSVTSEDALGSPPDIVDANSPLILASEVKDLTFSYWDGTAWQDTWDSGTLGSDGVTPVGPPQAIAISLTVAVPGVGTQSEVKTRTYRQVVVIPTANGAAQQSTTDGSTTSSTGSMP